MKNIDAKITIIIPVYKIEEEYLRTCIVSIKNQTVNAWNVILIDDGSPDKCGQICDELALNDNRIRVIHQENQGVSVARNAGIDMANSEWVTFVDPDDWVEPNYIEKVLEFINCHEKLDIIMFDYWREYRDKPAYESLNQSSGVLPSEELKNVQRGPFYKLIQNGNVNPYAVPAIWNKLYKRDFLNKNSIRYLSEARKGQDRLFNAKALLVTKNIGYIHMPFYHYRCYGNSVTNRFNKRIVELTEIELIELSKQIQEHSLDTEFGDIYNCRAVTRLYSCLRLYFFHPENEESKKTIRRELNQLLEKPLFNKALSNVKYELLSIPEKIFVFCLQKRWYGICEKLVSYKTRITKNRLSG